MRLACKSPWLKKYDPPLEDGTVPYEEMRNLEIEANEACFVVSDGQGTRGYMQIGLWDVIHVIQMSMTLAAADGHLVNMGKMIEEREAEKFTGPGLFREDEGNGLHSSATTRTA